MTRIGRLVANRSLAVATCGTVAIVAGLSTYLRSRGWTHEWLWTIDNAVFAVILTGPLVAGLSAAELRGLARARPLLAHAQRGPQAAALHVAAIAVGAWSAMFATLISAVAFTKALGMPGWPTPIELAAAVPMATILPLWATLGGMLGYRFPATITPPLTTIGVFAAVMGAYLIQWTEPLVGVGGATGTVIGLQPNLARIAWQAALHLLLAGLCLASLSCVVRTGRTWPTSTAPAALYRVRIAAAACAVAAAGTGIALTAASPDRFVDDPAPRSTCVQGTHVQICTGVGYAQALPEATQVADETAVLVADYGLAVPTEFRQDTPWNAAGTVGHFSPEDVPTFGVRETIATSYANWYAANACPEFTADSRQAFSEVQAWLLWKVAGLDYEDPTIPRVLVTGSAAEQTTALHDALDRMAAACE